MKVLADESVDRQIVDRLRRDGHVVHYVAEMAPGVSDDVVLNLLRSRPAGGAVLSPVAVGECQARTGTHRNAITSNAAHLRFVLLIVHSFLS